MTEMEAAQVQENLNRQLRDQLGFTESPAAKLEKQLDLLKFALNQSAITQAEYADKVREAMEKYDPATQAAAELAKETQRLADRFRETGKTPLEAFKELSVDLRRIQHLLNPVEFASAKDKLLADLANGLGVSQFLAEVKTPAQQLATAFKNLEAYAREAGLTQQQLTAAKNRATEALMKQSEYYNLYQKAQDSMLTTQEKLNRELNRIAEEAKKWGWDSAIVAKMKALKTEELLGKREESLGKFEELLDGIQEWALPEISGGSGKVDQSRNAALEFGTVAYYEAQMKGNKPLEDLTKKTNRHLGNIETEIKRQNKQTPMKFTVIH